MQLLRIENPFTLRVAKIGTSNSTQSTSYSHTSGKSCRGTKSESAPETYQPYLSIFIE